MAPSMTADGTATTPRRPDRCGRIRAVILITVLPNWRQHHDDRPDGSHAGDRERSMTVIGTRNGAACQLAERPPLVRDPDTAY